MPATTTRQLLVAASALGLPSGNAEQLIAAAAGELRAALDDGLPRTHARCEALLLLINAARLHLVPRSERLLPRTDGASRSTDEIAHEIDKANAGAANAMGLADAEALRRHASTLVKSSRRASTPDAAATRSKMYSLAVAKRTGPMKLRLLPRASLSSAEALAELVRGDAELGRAVMLRKDAQLEVRRRRASRGRPRGSGRRPSTDGRLATGAAYNAPTVGMQTRYQAAHPGANAHHAHTPASHIISPMQPHMYQRHAAHLPPAQLAHAQVPYLSHHMLQNVHSMQQPAHHHLPFANVDHDTLNSSYNLSSTSNPALSASSSLSNDSSLSPTPKDANAFRAFSIRQVLVARERNVLRRLSERRAELLALPIGVSEDVRRKAIIESKQMKLLETQRRVRSKLCVEMKKAWSPSYQEMGVVPNDNLSRLFRRQQPVCTYTDGYPRVSVYDDGVPPVPKRTLEKIHTDSRNLATFDRRRMLYYKHAKKQQFAYRLQHHVRLFEEYYSYGHLIRGRICKAVLKYFQDKARAEEKRKKQEQIERLRLLRSNDETAYFNLLKSTKNERLLQLVRQTDNYLMQIGASVERVRDQKAAMSDEPNIFNQELQESQKADQSVDAMRGRRDMYYTVTHSVSEDVQQPSIMVHGKLKPYQMEGLKWLVSLYNNNLNGILADEMGLGKTIQTIALLTYLIQHKQNPGPYLVVVPLSTVGNWVREMNLWAPSVNKIVYKGNRKAREEAQWELERGNFNVVITTYEFVVRDLNILGRYVWKYIIIDEGHRMKNAKCKLAITLGMKYRSRNRLLLTGTPLQNNLTELWALLNFLLPSIFSSSDTFEQWFQRPFETRTLGDTAELEEEETLLVINRLHQVLRPFLLRRLKTDVETQLPEKTESVINCDMSKWQWVLYRQVKNKVGLAMGEHGSVRSFNNLLMQCKKICNHPYLFYDEEALMNLPDEMLIRSSGKFHLLQHMIPKLKASGHRTLIFSQMTAALDYLEDFLTAIEVKYMRLDGGTKSEMRQDMLETFNAPNSPYFCFLLSTRAGGLGLNLQTADTVIIFDSDWNPMMDLQAQDRAHRIGQKNAVRVYRLASAGTVEDDILERANQKLRIDAQVIQAGQFNNKSTEVDQRQMLKSLLTNKAKDDGDSIADIPGMEELNRILARNEEEFELFTKMDAERADSDRPYKALFTDEAELPSWVLQPEVQQKTAEEREQEMLRSHGRGRRKRTQIRDFDQLTEKEWMDVMQGHVEADEVFERRRRKEKRKNDDSESDDGDDSDEDAVVDVDADDEAEGRTRNGRGRSPRKRRRVSKTSNAVMPRTRGRPKRRSAPAAALVESDSGSEQQSSPALSEEEEQERPEEEGATSSATAREENGSGGGGESIIMRLRLKEGAVLPPMANGVHKPKAVEKEVEANGISKKDEDGDGDVQMKDSSGSEDRGDEDEEMHAADSKSTEP